MCIASTDAADPSARWLQNRLMIVSVEGNETRVGIEFEPMNFSIQ